MEYNVFRKQLDKETYFSTWESEKLSPLSDEMKDYVYMKYKLKCDVFNRDNFKCTNIDCQTPDSPITLHHVKAQRNNGEHKARNCVTLCKTCHQAFERAKRGITLCDTVPPHLRGHTFKLDKPERVDWKAIRLDMKDLRREIKFKLDDSIKQLPVGQRQWFKLTWEQIAVLMKALTIPYEEWDD